MKIETLAIILGMAVVTFVPRFLPMVLLTKWTLPEKMKQGLDYMPTAILSAIVFPLLFFDSASVLSCLSRRSCFRPSLYLSSHGGSGQSGCGPPGDGGVLGTGIYPMSRCVIR